MAVLLQAQGTELVDVASLDPRFVIDMMYARQDNFTGHVIYPVARCLLRPEVGQMLVQAQKYLDAHHPGYVMMIKDAYRPVHVQWMLWNVVKDTSMRDYVADPNSKVGSVHNYGAAVDLTLIDASKHEVDMGTIVDYLGDLAEPRYEERFVKEGKLTQVQVANRHMLRDAMLHAGFKTIPNEWWHFDALSKDDLIKTYTKLDIPLEDFGAKNP